MAKRYIWKSFTSPSASEMKPEDNSGISIWITKPSIFSFQVHYTTVDNVPVTIFVPDTILAEEKHTTMVYFHGGGWTWLSVGRYLS